MFLSYYTYYSNASILLQETTTFCRSQPLVGIPTIGCLLLQATKTSQPTWLGRLPFGHFGKRLHTSKGKQHDLLPHLIFGRPH